MQRRSIGKNFGDREAPSVNDITDDEISLVDIWLVVRRRWVWPLVGLIAGISIAATYLVVATPVYETQATIQIGKVHDFGAIEDIGLLTARLLEEYGQQHGRPQMPYLKHATKASNNVLKLVAVGYSAQEAKDFLARVVIKVMERQEQVYENVVVPLRRQLAVVEDRTKRLAVQEAEFGELVDRLKKSQPAQASIIAIERRQLDAKLGQLENERLVLQRQIGKPFTTPSEVIAPAAFPETPVSPRRLAVVSIGIVLGFVLGLCATFVGELFAKTRVRV